MNLKAVLLICLILFLFSCKENAISVSKDGDVEILEFFFERIPTGIINYEVEKLIPLETTESNYLSENLLVKFTSDFIFVFDDEKRDAIHQFDLKGRYLSKLISVGEGPEQVGSINDFIISEKNIEILSGKGAYTELVYYSLEENKIIKTLKLDIIGFSFEKIGDSYFIYSSYNLPFAEYRISKVDTQGNIIENHLKNDYSGTLMPVVERNFFNSMGSIFFLESFSNHIYEVTSDQLKIKYKIDFGPKNIKKEFFEQDMMIAFERLNLEGFYNVLNHFESKNLALTNLFYQKENLTEQYQILFEKDKQEVVKQKLNGPLGEVLKYPVGITDSDVLIFSASPVFLLKNTELMNSNLELKEEDNPVLIFMKILN